MFKHDIAVTIVDTPKEKELRALREIAADRIHWQYVARQRQQDEQLAWDLLWQIKASLPRPTGGALFVSGSMRIGGPVPEQLQVWPTPHGTPSF